MHAATQRYQPEAVTLSGTEFAVEQTGKDENMRPEYEARDVTGNTVFTGRYEMYREKDTVRFADSDGNEVCAVTANGTWDIAGDYRLTDSHTGEDLVVFENDFSMLRDTWRVRDADDGSLLAEIESRGGLATIGRTVLPLGQWIGHEYEITDSEGNTAGSIGSGFAILDEYDITLTDSGSVPPAPIVIGTAVIDAIHGN